MTNIAIVGAGQVGTGAGLNALHSGFANAIVYYDNNPKHVGELYDVAKANGFPNSMRATGDFSFFRELVSSADLVVLATPPDTYEKITSLIAPHMKPDAGLTDVGSVKQYSIDNVLNGLKIAKREDIEYLGSHPNKGNERQGPHAAETGMYHDATVFLVPTGQAASAQNSAAYSLVENFWQSQGARTHAIDAKTHDFFFGITSHCEHSAIAFPLTLMGLDANEQLLAEYKNAGTTLRNTTRVATAVPSMWLPIFKGNAGVIAEGTAGLMRRIDSLALQLREGATGKLQEVLEEARRARQALAVADVRNNTPRENIMGEIMDCVGITHSLTPHLVSEELRLDGKEQVFARITLVPSLIGSAAMLNAQAFLGEKIDLPSMINPSFLDGSAPALNNSAYMAKLYVDQKSSVLNVLEEYRQRAAQMTTAIASANESEQARLIDLSRQTRLQMPLARRAQPDHGTTINAAVRKAYMIEPAPMQPPVAVSDLQAAANGLGGPR